MNTEPIRRFVHTAPSVLRALFTGGSRLAFVHVMKTGGTYVHDYLFRHVLYPRGYRIRNSWTQGLERDFTTAELESFLAARWPLSYVHNHAGGWSAGVAERYRSAGYRLFAFYRHPGDQWCSYYFWARKQPGVFAPDTTLDVFLRTAWSGGYPIMERELNIPDWWREDDFLAVLTPDSFRSFLRQHFAHGLVPHPRANTSENRGYEHYRAQGLISDATHELLLASPQWVAYQRLLPRS